MEQGDYEGARRELELALGYRKDHPAALHNLQLIAEAKGGSMTLPSGHNDSSWRRFVRTLEHVFIGSGTESKPAVGVGGARLAAAPNGGSQ
jgi:hypothetical protein